LIRLFDFFIVFRGRNHPWNLSSNQLHWVISTISPVWNVLRLLNLLLRWTRPLGLVLRFG
jgi:hypothetical protein